MLYVCRWYTQLVCGLLRSEACGGGSRGADCPHCRSWLAQGVRWLVRRILVNSTKLLMCLSPPPRRPLVPSGGLWQLWAAERHLWLILSDIKDRDRVFLLDAPLLPSGLFGDAVDSVVDRQQEAGGGDPVVSPSPLSSSGGCSRPLPCTGSSYGDAQKESVAARAPPQTNRDRGGKNGSRSRTSQPKPDLWTVL